MRYKVYYPSSQVITGLYTKGKEWMTIDGKEYIGFYHRYTDGYCMTEAEYNRFSSKHIIAFVDSERDSNVAEYKTVVRDLRKIKPIDIPLAPRTSAPMQMYPIPVLKDYEKGKYIRYFLKRRNTTNAADIFEIDKDQYTSWKTVKAGIDERLFDAIKMDWKLTGPKFDEGVPPNITYGVEDTNKRMVFLKNREFKGLIDFLTNYTEWSVHSPLVSEDIKKMFGSNS